MTISTSYSLTACDGSNQENTLGRMQFVNGFLFIVLALSVLPGLPGRAQAVSECSLVVHVDGIRNQKGDIGVSLFTSSDGWPENNDKAFLHGPHPFSGDKATVTLEVPAGRYGVAVIHDENSNHKLDRNFFGIPKEGFGFANNPKVFLTPPDFKTASVEVGCPVTETTIHLIYK